MNFTCYDIIKMAVDGLEYSFGEYLSVNPWKERALKNVSEYIDDLAYEVGATGFGVVIDEDTAHIIVSVESPGIFITGKDSAFYDVVKRSISVEAVLVNDESMKVKFELNGIWDERSGDNK